MRLRSEGGRIACTPPRPSNLFHGNAPHSGMSGRRARGEAPLLLDKLWTNARKDLARFGAKYSVLRAECDYVSTYHIITPTKIANV